MFNSSAAHAVTAAIALTLAVTLGATFAPSPCPAAATPAAAARARDLGIPFDGTPGPHNAITDVAGVLVGHTTLISGSGKLKVGEGPVRTGVTAVLPARTRLPVESRCSRAGSRRTATAR